MHINCLVDVRDKNAAIDPRVTGLACWNTNVAFTVDPTVTPVDAIHVIER